MAATRTTTVRLSDEDLKRLDVVAPIYGGRSGAIREALRLLSEQHQQLLGLRAFVDEWNEEIGPPDPADIDAIVKHLGR